MTEAVPQHVVGNDIALRRRHAATRKKAVDVLAHKNLSREPSNAARHKGAKQGRPFSMTKLLGIPHYTGTSKVLRRATMLTTQLAFILPVAIVSTF